MIRRSTLFVIAASSIAASFGGWAVTTIHQMPDYVVAGKPVNLEFTVRQHGFQYMSGLKPELEARSGTTSLRATALPGKGPGVYASTITLPHAGEWTITIAPGWGKAVTLLPLQAIEPGAKPVTYTEAERGRRLFVAKGCVTCHGEIAIGPELASREFPVDYLKQLLADPAATFGSRRGAKEMPNLNLSQQEIGSLAAFVSNSKRAAVR